MIVAAFRVLGQPVAQGSMRERVVRRRKVGQRSRFLVHADPRLSVWRDTIAKSARAHGVQELAAPTPVAVSCTFYLPKLGAGRLCPVPVHKRDLDKLLRAVLDALKSIAWTDDGQVTEFGTVRKRWADAANPPGIAVVIECLEL